ncbi:Uncharacterized protein OBRU01_06931, partial [Operophtera brumata]
IDSAFSMTPFSDDFVSSSVNAVHEGDGNNRGVFVNYTILVSFGGDLTTWARLRCGWILWRGRFCLCRVHMSGHDPGPARGERSGPRVPSVPRLTLQRARHVSLCARAALLQSEMVT